MGFLMKTANDAHEYYVIEINGQVNSMHRRYLDALKAGLQLKYQFPHDDIKVCEIDSAESALH